MYRMLFGKSSLLRHAQGPVKRSIDAMAVAGASGCLNDSTGKGQIGNFMLLDSRSRRAIDAPIACRSH